MVQKKFGRNCKQQNGNDKIVLHRYIQFFQCKRIGKSAFGIQARHCAGAKPINDAILFPSSRLPFSDVPVFPRVRRRTARVHARSPQRYIEECAKTIKEGSGFPKLLNDEEIVLQLVSNGAKIHEAFDYAVSGCAEARMPNRDTFTSGGVYINFASAIEMMMYNGRTFKTGDELLGIETGDVETFETWDDVWNAYVIQAKNLLRHAFIQQKNINRLREELIKTQDENRKVYRDVARLERAVSKLERAINKATGCRHFDDCPIRNELSEQQGSSTDQCSLGQPGKRKKNRSPTRNATATQPDEA